MNSIPWKLVIEGHTYWYMGTFSNSSFEYADINGKIAAISWEVVQQFDVPSQTVFDLPWWSVDAESDAQRIAG